MRRALAAVGLLLTLSMGLAYAGDWPQWRGPERNGISPETVPLVDKFPADGLVPVWTSEDIPGGDRGGYGSVSVAGGKAYVFVNWRYDDPIEPRTLSRGELAGMGWAPGIPEELSQAVEQARLSDERAGLKGDDPVNKWAAEWMKQNLKPEDRKFGGAVQARLRAGKTAVPLEDLAKLSTIANKEFPNQAALDEWFKANEIGAGAQEKVTSVVPKTVRKAKDRLYCLDADGLTLWKVEWDGNWMWYPGSCTPSIIDGRCYVVTTNAVMICLDADKGTEIWKSEPLGAREHTHNRSSSVLVVDGIAVAHSETRMVGLDVRDGRILWSNPKVKHKETSAVVWKSGGKTYLITASGEPDKSVHCIDPATGQSLWSVPGGEVASTPAVVGDVMAFAGETDNVGLTAYRLSADKPTQLWTVPFKERYASPVIYKDCVYVIGGGNETYGVRNKGRALCVELASGKVAWDVLVGNEGKEGRAELSSPVVADGKVLAVVYPWLYMLKASPEGFTILDRANLRLTMYTSPTIADGKLYLRTNRNVVCYDLARDRKP